MSEVFQSQDGCGSCVQHFCRWALLRFGALCFSLCQGTRGLSSPGAQAKLFCVVSVAIFFFNIAKVAHVIAF